MVSVVVVVQPAMQKLEPVYGAKTSRFSTSASRGDTYLLSTGTAPTGKGALLACALVPFELVCTAMSAFGCVNIRSMTGRRSQEVPLAKVGQADSAGNDYDVDLATIVLNARHPALGDDDEDL